MLKIGICGLGGFANAHHKAMLTLEKEGLCKVLCTCDPAPDAFAAQMTELDFDSRGIKVFDHYLKMLEEFGPELDVVTIPTPIPFHAEMHKACVDRGIAVYLEKPPTVNYEELDEMIEVDKNAKKMTHVGFNFIIEQPRQDLKQRILSGEFGAIKEAQFCGLWPRNNSYFRRAEWPARLVMDGRLVLDSCMSNAMGHYLHNTLFWLGKGELLSWGSVAETDAELYRSHDIEGFDTVFAKGKTEAGEGVRICFTHALAGKHGHYERVICKKATLTYRVGRDYDIRWVDGRTEKGGTGEGDHLTSNMRRYLQYVNGEIDRPLTRLIDCKPFVEYCDLVYVAAKKITQVPDAYLDREEGWVALRGLPEAVEEFFHTGAYPSDQNLPWAQPGGHATRAELPKLRSIVESML